MIRILAATCLILGAIPLFSADESASLEFLRGDANFDGRVDLSDPILTLQNLFLEGARFRCPDSADSDDSGGIDISDAIRSLSFLFLGMETPLPPFPVAGPDPTEDSLDCFSPPGGDDLEPPRPISPGEVEAVVASFEEANGGLQAVNGAIEVSPELFDFLSGLGPGETFEGRGDVPGLDAFIAAALEDAPAPGTPVAVPSHLRAPADAGGCHEIDPAKLRGLSRDFGPGATPDDELLFDVEPRVVCGVGPHVVRFTVTDADGLSSWATTRVDLCAAADADCDEAVSSPGGPASPGLTQRLNCVWIATKRLLPAATVSFTRGVHYDTEGRTREVDEKRPVRVGENPLVLLDSSNGAGPEHEILVARSLPNCETPLMSRALHGYGQATIRMNLLCFSSDDCTIAFDPPCKAAVAVEGSYEATVRAATEAGPPCDGPLNEIEALVQEEAKLEVNGSPLFNKALAVQTGTAVRKRISLAVTGRVGVNERGVAADVAATHGLSHEIWSRTGRRTGVLQAFSSASPPTLPVTADLTAMGKAELIAGGTANGMAAAATEAYAVYAVGTTNCPGAGTVLIRAQGGRGAALARVELEVQDFYRQHTGSKLLPPPRENR